MAGDGGGVALEGVRGSDVHVREGGLERDELAATWQKVAVQAPNYARLAGDGLTVSEGDAGSQIRLTLKDYPPDNTSLLTWHNVPSTSATAGKVSVQVDGVTQVSNLSQTTAALSNSIAPSSYVTFTAQAGKDVVVLFTSTASLVINGFELDTPNVAEQATEPVPGHKDEHVDADDGSVELSWTAAQGAASHDVYFGTDPNVVQAATHGVPRVQGQSGEHHVRRERPQQHRSLLLARRRDRFSR